MAEVPATVSVIRILPPEKWVQRQITNLERVGRANYLTGISVPKRHTINRGIQAEPRFVDTMQKVLAEGRRAAGLKIVTLEEWFGYARDIGADRLVPGVTKRRAKVERFVGAWNPIILDHAKKLDELPIVTLEDRINKMVTNVRGLVALKGKWKRK